MPTAPPTTEPSIQAHVFWLRYQKEIAAALIVLIVAMVGYGGYRLYSVRRDTAAAESLGNAKTQADYENVIASYSGTPASASAYLLLAEKQRSEKKFAEANTTLQKFIENNPDHDLVPTARLAMAANLELMGKEGDALAIYQQVASKYGNSYVGPLAMISQVPLLKAMNRIEDARRVCEEMLTRYRMPGQQQTEGTADTRMETVWVGEAMRQLRSLKPPEQPKAPPAAANAPPAMIAAPSARPAGPPPAGVPTPQKPK